MEPLARYTVYESHICPNCRVQLWNPETTRGTFFSSDVNGWLTKACTLPVLQLSLLDPLGISQNCMQLTPFLGESSNESCHASEDAREDVTSCWWKAGSKECIVVLDFSFDESTSAATPERDWRRSHFNYLPIISRHDALRCTFLHGWSCERSNGASKAHKSICCR